MSKFKGGVEHVTVSTSFAVSTKPCIYYGCVVINNTTNGVSAVIFDATGTAQGAKVDGITVTAGTNANNGVYYQNGIIMHSGIFVSALIATTASDSIVVFYGGL